MQRKRWQTVRFQSGPGPLDNPLKGWAPYWFNWLTQYYQPISMNFWYVSWRELEPNPQDYRFTTWEQRWNATLARNNHVVFRVYLDYPGQPTGVPQWLIDQGVEMRPYSEHGGGLSPDYDDPRLINALVRLIQAMGARYNSNPRVAFIQLGFLGFWGEWHTYPRTELFASESTQRTVVDAMRAAFPNKILQARTANGYLGAHSWMGFHDDMFPEDTDGSADWYFLPNLRRARRDQNWKVACIGGELVPGQALRWLTTDWSRTRSMLEAGHFSYLGPYCPPLENITDSTFVANSQWMVRRMGYEYRLKEARWATPLNRGQRLEGVVVGTNQGVAPFYYPWEVRMALLTPSDAVARAWQVKADLRQWMPGAEFYLRFLSPVLTVPRGTYRLGLGIIDPWKRTPRIRFANNLSVVDGWTILGTVQIT